MADKVIQFPNQEQEANMNPEDLKLLLEQNIMLKHCLRVMNKIPLGDAWGDGTPIKDDEIDYMQIWNTISLNKKIDPGEVSADAIGFYFQLMSLGYDNFGSMFFQNMAESENAPYLQYAIKCFLEFMTDLSKKEENNEEK